MIQSSTTTASGQHYSSAKQPQNVGRTDPDGANLGAVRVRPSVPVGRGVRRAAWTTFDPEE